MPRRGTKSISRIYAYIHGASVPQNKLQICLPGAQLTQAPSSKIHQTQIFASETQTDDERERESELFSLLLKSMSSGARWKSPTRCFRRISSSTHTLTHNRARGLLKRRRIAYIRRQTHIRIQPTNRALSGASRLSNKTKNKWHSNPLREIEHTCTHSLWLKPCGVELWKRNLLAPAVSTSLSKVVGIKGNVLNHHSLTQVYTVDNQT